ncbi:hypothetical protein V500_00013 [Pseudogymnoascus sp. VKM F-4518 (FW-2643)]|nr:hypothetical protein V500_00013 [Pseudogymnoascus sp. VKM F-4518 (FW-2643)]
MSSSKLSHQAALAQMSLTEKLAFTPKLLSVVTQTILALIGAPFRDRSTTPSTIKRHVMYTAVRALVDTLTPHQNQYRAPHTDDIYAAYCKIHKLTPESEILQDGTRAHWIGPRNAKKIILYLHGGGYVIPAEPYSFAYLHTLRESLRDSVPAEEIPSVLFLSYDLAPGAQFPRQLIQASALLTHIVTNLRIDLSSIILAGDSAGGNLSLALLSHLAHPYPAVPAVPLPAGAKFLGAILISPWSDFSTSNPGYALNARKDELTPAFLVKCSTSFLGTPYPHAVDANTNYTQPALAEAEWWDGIPVDDILITGGEDEILIDGVKAVAARLSKGRNGVQLLAAKDEAHEGPLLATLLAEPELGASADMIKSWVKSRL